MANSTCDVPDDWWGLTKKEVEQIVKQYRPGTAARLTNEDYEYRGSHEDFQITDVGKFRIVARSKKGLRRVLMGIRDYAKSKASE
jgi:hypothetical protein